MHHGAGEIVEAGELRWLRLREDAGGADHVAGGDGRAFGYVELPEVALGVELGADDLGAEADPRAQAIAVDAVVRVGLQLPTLRVHAGPVRALLEGELIAERGDVDADARVGVPVPGPADPVALLEQDPLADPGLVQLDRRADPGEAGSDHRDLEIRLRAAAHGGTEFTPGREGD